PCCPFCASRASRSAWSIATPPPRTSPASSSSSPPPRASPSSRSNCGRRTTATPATRARKGRSRKRERRPQRPSLTLPAPTKRPSHLPALAVVALHPAVDLGDVGAEQLLDVPLQLLADAGPAGQHAGQHELGERAGDIEVGAGRRAALARRQEGALVAALLA